MADTKITEKYEFLTQIITAYDSSEQRMALRTNPRHYVSYNYDAMSATEAQWIRGILNMQQTDTIYIPQWQRTCDIVEDSVEGSTSILLDSTDIWGFKNAYALMFFSEDAVNGGGEVYQIRHILTNNMVGLQKQLTSKKYIGIDHVVPLLNCYVQPTDSTTYTFSRGTTTVLNYEVLADQNAPLFPSIFDINTVESSDSDLKYGIPTSYNLVSIFRLEPIWIEDISDKIEKNAEKLDNESGRIFYDSKSASIATTRDIKYTLTSRIDIDNLVKMFYRVKGMQTSFYIPSWLTDFEPAFDIGRNDMFFYTNLNSLYKFYANNNRRKLIIMFMNDYTVKIVKITAYSYETIDDVTYGKVYIESSFGILIRTRDINMISYLMRVRFNSDMMTLDYDTTFVADTTLSFKEVDQ